MSCDTARKVVSPIFYKCSMNDLLQIVVHGTGTPIVNGIYSNNRSSFGICMGWALCKTPIEMDKDESYTSNAAGK